MACAPDDAAHHRGIARLIADQRWSPPRTFVAGDLEDRSRMEALVASGQVQGVVDPIEALADEVYEVLGVGRMTDAAARSTFCREFLAKADSYGTWVFFPWSRELVRYPGVAEHRSLRTFRNRDLITRAEQDVLLRARIAVFGLSVGSNVVDQFVQLGIGGHYLLADADRVSPSNLNRLRASMRHVSMTKLDLAACKLSEADPYVEQVHLVGGYDDGSDEVLMEFRPDLIVEEVDAISVKARIRRFAERTGTPVLMVGDIGERTVIDVERHDLGTVRPFNGRIDRTTFDRLADGTAHPKEELRALVRIVGPSNLSLRLIHSATMVDDDLGGWPQLGSVAAAGAAVASVAARALLGHEPLRSGRYVLAPRRLLGLRPRPELHRVFATVRGLRRGLAT